MGWYDDLSDLMEFGVIRDAEPEPEPADDEDDDDVDADVPTA